jgi:hypothetical protein
LVPELVSVTVTVQLIESSTATVVGVQLIEVLVVRRMTVIEAGAVVLLPLKLAGMSGV